MEKNRISDLSKQFYNDLVDDTMRFWVDHGIDWKFGGYKTYLDRKGDPLSSYKPMWVMARFAWVFARLYNTLEKQQEWLDLARHGIEFIQKHGFDDDGRMYFLVDKEGRPVQKRRYLFTETFSVIALAEYAKAAGDKAALEAARKLMKLILDHYTTPGSLPPKYYPEQYSVRGHSMAMIQINTLQILRDAAVSLGSDTEIPRYGDCSNLIDKAIDEVFTYFVKPDKMALLETVGPDGEYLGDLPEGRCINPGHPIETAWFIMEEGKYRDDMSLVKRALPILDWSLERGWDPEHGGIFYFLDVEGRQPVQLEWDMKLWWPHNEAIYAALLAYQLTGESRYENWFDKVLDWSLKRFPDEKYGEWIGYLHRDGSIALDMKGNIFKGPFHLPRQQLNCHLILKEMLEK
jgi:N-acylglucosamine 2-epimerase